MFRVVGLALALVVCLWAPAGAQEPATRAEANRRAREEKGAEATPPKQNAVERAMHFAEERSVFLLDREGFYPKLGSLTIGSGFAYGLGFRDRNLFANRGALDLFAAASIQRYWATEARLSFPRLARNRLHVEGWASHRDYPQENYFGLGPESLRADRSDYAIRTNAFGGRAGVRPVRGLLIGGGLEYLTPRIGTGTQDRFANLPDRFDPATVPGLTGTADYLRSSAFAEVDYRQPRNARQGGWYRFDYSRYSDRRADAFSFDRFDADLRQYVGFLAGRRVFTARALFSTTNAVDGQTTPFYYMPTLGGNETLRGFRAYRFRAPHAMLLQGEYRWELWSGLDAALFYDTGKVADRRGDLNFSNLEHDYGFGFRFNTDNGIVLRVDTALGSRDGRHLHIVFGGTF